MSPPDGKVEPMSRTPLQWLTPAEAATFEAVSARIIPGTPDDPGAREAEVAIYLDRALAGAYASLRTFYHLGLARLDAYAREAHGQPFAQLAAALQDAALHLLESGAMPTFPPPSEDGDDYHDPAAAVFFAVMRRHTIEGMFSDPMYGGNRNGNGWRLIGYPGPRFGYSRADMLPGANLSGQAVTTLADLRDFYDRGDDRDPIWSER